MNTIEGYVYDEIFGDVSLDPQAERRSNLKIIWDAFSLDVWDTLNAMHDHGPLYDGDVPSKSQRDDLLTYGYCSKVFVKGAQGYNACTYKGAALKRCRDAIINIKEIK